MLRLERCRWLCTIIGFCKDNWVIIEGRFGRFLRSPPVVDEDLKLILRSTRGATVGPYPVDGKPCMRYWKFTKVARGYRRVELRRGRIDPKHIHLMGEMAVRYEMLEVGPTASVRPTYLRST